MKLLKAVLLVEDNPGDARLVREMFNEHNVHDSELSHVASMGEAENICRRISLTLYCSISGCPMSTGLMRYGGYAPPRH